MTAFIHGATFQVTAAALLGLTGVIFGAFGAHGLAARGLTPAQIGSWDTAVQYQMVHALALLTTSVWMRHSGPSELSIAGVAWVVGVILFSGSIYVLVLGGPRWLGPVTPFGGIALIIGWGALLIGAFRS